MSTRNYFKKQMLYVPLIGIVLLFLLQTGPVQAAAPQCGQWSISQSPSPGASYNSLNAVASVSTNDVWAVGFYSNSGYGPSYGLIEQWNGQKWRRVPSPQPHNSSIHLVGVSAISASDIWAVGYIEYGEGPIVSLTEHWDGSSWSIVPSPNANTDDSLLGVAGDASNDVWSVGYSGKFGSDQDYALIEHWDGQKWSIVVNPTLPGQLLTAVTIISTNDVWAVGYFEASNYTQQPLAEHWNGSSWSVVTTSIPSGFQFNDFAGVSASSSDDVWAVGDAANYGPTYEYESLIEHWNGSTWSIVRHPSPAKYYSFLYGVVAIGPDDAWTVGAYDSANQPLTEHWNGSSWSVVSGPIPPQKIGGFLNGVTASSASDIWTVGGYYDNNNIPQTMIGFYC